MKSVSVEISPAKPFSNLTKAVFSDITINLLFIIPNKIFIYKTFFDSSMKGKTDRWKDVEEAQKDPEFIRAIYEWVRKTCSP